MFYFYSFLIVVFLRISYMNVVFTILSPFPFFRLLSSCQIHNLFFIFIITHMHIWDIISCKRCNLVAHFCLFWLVNMGCHGDLVKASRLSIILRYISLSCIWALVSQQILLATVKYNVSIPSSIIIT